MEVNFFLKKKIEIKKKKKREKNKQEKQKLFSFFFCKFLALEFKWNILMLLSTFFILQTL